MSSMMDRWHKYTRLSWAESTAAVGLVLLLLALGAAHLDGVLGQAFSAGHWRVLIGYPAVVVYILAIAPPVGQAGQRARQALRQLVTPDDGDNGNSDEARFDRLVSETSVAVPRRRWVAFALVALTSLWIGRPWELAASLPWIHLYGRLASALIFGMLGWVIYAGLAQARIMGALHRHVQSVDILELRAFDPIGRYGLVSVLAFIGGALLSLLFDYGTEITFEASEIFLYGLVGLAATLMFFLPMRQTHRLMASAKDRELGLVQRHIVAAYRSLERLQIEGGDINALSRELDLWLAYEQRIKALRTWPYNLGMLRTLFVSVLSPIGISLLQRLLRQLFNL